MKRCVLIAFLVLQGLANSSFADFFTFSNTTLINIPTLGIADLYPAPITVSGVTGSIVNVRLTISGLTHLSSDDLAAAVVSPNGTAALLFSGPGNQSPAGRVINANLTFDDNAAAALPDTGTIVSGTYKPGQFQWDDTFPAPGPGLFQLNNLQPHQTLSFNRYRSENPNGQWNLYVMDAIDFDGGRIAGGWSLTFETVTAVPEPSSFLMTIVAASGFLGRRRRGMATSRS